MLGNTERETRVYLNITNGKIVLKTERGTQKYDFVQGILERIYPKEREFRGEKVPYWYIELRDQETKSLYTLGLNASSGVWRSIILSLGSAKSFKTPVRIKPYKSGDFDKVVVYSGEDKLDWVSDLPKVEEIQLEGKVVKSTTKRDSFIKSLVEQVNELVKNG